MANDIQVAKATTTLVPSLATLEVRAFHPMDDFYKRLFPDTPLLHQWWSEIITSEISDSTCHPLAASYHDPNRNEEIAVGILLMRRFEPDERGAGCWTTFPITPDHDHKMYEALVAGMLSNKDNLMQGRKHYLLEFFGVDQEFQRKGIGSRLLRYASHLASREEAEIFVQANMYARPFYEKEGFELKEEIPQEGSDMVECLLVKRPSSLK